jgi:O-antigen/teichoic acid export membrane protein
MSRIPIVKIIQNFGFLTVSRVLSDLITFVLFVVLSRYFGQEGIGQYAFAMAFAGFFAMFADFGLYGLSVRVMSRATGSIPDAFSRFIALRGFMALVVLVILLASLPFLPFSGASKPIIGVVGTYVILKRLNEGMASLFVAREETHVEAALEISFRTAAALIGTLVVVNGGDLITAVSVLPALAAVQLIATYGVVCSRYGRPCLVPGWTESWQTLREAVPFALSGFSFQIYSRLDILMLGLMLSEAVVGIFSIARRIIDTLLFIPYNAALAITPLACKLYAGQEEDFRILYQRSIGLASLVGLPAAAGVWLIAPGVIRLIFGEAFVESVAVLRLLAVLLLLAFLNRTVGVFLMASNREGTRAKSQGVACGVNLAANLLLIPGFGAVGAAAATLMSDFVVLVLYMTGVKDLVGWPRVSSRLAIGALGVTAFCLPFATLDVSTAIVIPVSILIYAATLLAFAETRQNEVHMLLELLKGLRKIAFPSSSGDDAMTAGSAEREGKSPSGSVAQTQVE